MSEAVSAQHHAHAIRQAAMALGFVRVGFATVEPFSRGGQALKSWLEQGYHGEMDYLATQGPREQPQSVLPEVRTIIAVALPYPKSAPAIISTRATLARYAQGADYHGVLKKKLRLLADATTQILGRPVLARDCVDTAPILEREAAARAGLGFIAKNTMLIAPGIGSNILLGELLVDVELPNEAEEIPPKCGSCTACLTACPTGAFVGPYVLDARRCISYLTIELRGVVPRALRPLMGTMVFGCDICQDVCPFNASKREGPVAPELKPRADLGAPDLVELLWLRNRAQKRLAKNSALRRISRQQLSRNAAIALGNCGDSSVVPELLRALVEHKSPLVRHHVAWALSRFMSPDVKTSLEKALKDESEELVRDEIAWALS